MIGPFQPGQSVRFTLSATVGGAAFSPTPTPTLTVWGPDGTVATPAVSTDGTGAYHGDWSVPLTARAGTWWFRWRSVGADATNTANLDTPFTINPLGF